MEKRFFDQPIKNDIKTYDNTWKNMTVKGETITQLVVC